MGVSKALQLGMISPTIAAIVIALTNAGWSLFAVRALSGATVALVAPSLTVIIASNYHGKQQAQAIGFLASAIPLAQVVSLLIAGAFASSIGWRWSFVLLSVIGLSNLALSFKLAPIEPRPDVVIDWTGAVLSSIGIIMLSAGFSFLNAWGFLRASNDVPFDVAGMSPVIFLMIGGVVLVTAFFRWSRKRMDAGEPPLFSLDVLRSSK